MKNLKTLALDNKQCPDRFNLSMINPLLQRRVVDNTGQRKILKNVTRILLLPYI